MIIQFSYKGTNRNVGIIKLTDDYIEGLDFEKVVSLPKEEYDIFYNLFKNYPLEKKEIDVDGVKKLRYYLEKFNSSVDLSPAFKIAYRRFKLSETDYDPFIKNEFEVETIKIKPKEEKITMSPNFKKEF